MLCSKFQSQFQFQTPTRFFLEGLLGISVSFLIFQRFLLRQINAGPKAFGGYSTTDNGFARFDHVRIPKGNMLSKFAGVTDAGEYVTPLHAKLSYGGVRSKFSFHLNRALIFCRRCCTSALGA
jgi:hypothetical protein